MEVDGEEVNFTGTFADKEITLYDDIMMDDPRTEELLDSIYHQWQLAQSKGEYMRTIVTLIMGPP